MVRAASRGWRELGTVTGRGIALAGAGAATGLLGAVALARGLQSHLFGITAFHLPIYISSTLVVVVCAAIASAFPARRAARVSPLEVIRSE